MGMQVACRAGKTASTALTDGLRRKRSAYSAQFKLQVRWPVRIANSFPAARSPRSMASAIPTKSWSGDAISIKAACRLSRARKKIFPK